MGLPNMMGTVACRRQLGAEKVFCSFGPGADIIGTVTAREVSGHDGDSGGGTHRIGAVGPLEPCAFCRQCI